MLIGKGSPHWGDLVGPKDREIEGLPTSGLQGHGICLYHLLQVSTSNIWYSRQWQLVLGKSVYIMGDSFLLTSLTLFSSDLLREQIFNLWRTIQCLWWVSSLLSFSDQDLCTLMLPLEYSQLWELLSITWSPSHKVGCPVRDCASMFFRFLGFFFFQWDALMKHWVIGMPSLSPPQAASIYSPDTGQSLILKLSKRNACSFLTMLPSWPPHSQTRQFAPKWHLQL
jgi:hypothetical protein